MSDSWEFCTVPGTHILITSIPIYMLKRASDHFSFESAACDSLPNKSDSITSSFHREGEQPFEKFQENHRIVQRLERLI